MSTADNLAAFHRVENTYLSTFQALGGLGLLLGTLGLGAVLLRNVMERRKELALLRAVGYRPEHLRTMVIAENAFLADRRDGDRRGVRLHRDCAGVFRSAAGICRIRRWRCCCWRCRSRGWCVIARGRCGDACAVARNTARRIRTAGDKIAYPTRDVESGNKRQATRSPAPQDTLRAE